MRIRSLLWMAVISASLPPAVGRAADDVRTMDFAGVRPEHRLSIGDLKLPADWSDYSHLVLEMKTATPQRFALWVYTADGIRRIEIQPFGQGAWLRASIPLQYLKGMDQSGSDLASTINRRTNSFWMSVWGPFGELKHVEEIGLAMDYPINHASLQIRNVHLSKSDEGSAFLDAQEVRDAWGQWALADWPRKIRSQEQLDREMAEERKALASPPDFGWDRFGGYRDTQGEATGFFHVQRVDGKWWFVDPEGRLFLSTGINGTPGAGGFGGRGARGGAAGGAPGPAATSPSDAQRLTNARLNAWGMSTGGTGRPITVMLRWNLNRQTMFLGLPDVYADDFAASIDASAQSQCTPRRDDPLVLGYFIGNEPPWGGREPEVVDMILGGPETATKAKLKAFLAGEGGDTAKRRKQFVVEAFQHYLETICGAVRKYDPHHLIIGIRFGGDPADDVMRLGRLFDVCSINVYEYEPTVQVQRAYRLTGRPVLIGEFHIGVPENGLGAGLVQAMSQAERGVAYRYYMEQAASLDGFLGAHWFQWRDEPVLGRMDGENYNIGFVDAADRPYPELVAAAQTTNQRLKDVHAGKVAPFHQKPQASEFGTPGSPWDK